MKRLELDIGDKFNDLLTEQSFSAKLTKEEFIRRAIATYAYLRNYCMDNKKISIVLKDGTIKGIILDEG